MPGATGYRGRHGPRATAPRGLWPRFWRGLNVVSVAAVPAVAADLKLTDEQNTMVKDLAAQARSRYVS